MTTSRSAPGLLASFCGIFFSLIPFVVAQDSTATPAPFEIEQAVPLTDGWNSVYLEVTPAQPDIEKVFAGTQVDKVAAFLRPVIPVEFITDPDEQSWKGEEWRVWYRPGTPEAPLTNLHSIYANQPFLVHSNGNTTLKVRGVAEPIETNWVPDSFNLVGLPADSDSPPTFAQYFANSSAHSPLHAYRLEGGRWRKIQSPLATQIRRGEAVWVYCKGPSRHQGSLEIQSPEHSGVVMSSSAPNKQLTFKNNGDDPAEVTITGFGDAFPVNIVYSVVAIDGIKTYKVPVGDSLGLPVIPSRSGIRIDLQLNRASAYTSQKASLMEVRSDTGILQRFPILSPSK